jgi:hypothetical protein
VSCALPRKANRRNSCHRLRNIISTDNTSITDVTSVVEGVKVSQRCASLCLAVHMT